MKEEVTQRNSGRLIQGIFTVLALLFFICIIIQVFLAGIGLFIEYGNWSYHTNFIHFFEFIPLLMLILSFFGGLPKELRWQCASLYIMIILQYITLVFSGPVPYLAALHPVIALLLFWRSLITANTAVKVVRKENND